MEINKKNINFKLSLTNNIEDNTMQEMISNFAKDAEVYDKFYNVIKFNRKSFLPSYTNNFKRNYVKSYDIPSNRIAEVKSLYCPSNASAINTCISDKVNCYILISYLTINIRKINIYTSPKLMNKVITMRGSKVIKNIVHKMFLIPEMNLPFTIKQLQQKVYHNNKGV